MSGSINTFLGGITAAADAIGDLTATYAATRTLAVPGVAIGFATGVAAAQNTATPAAPYASATTEGSVYGGYITSSHVGHLSVDFPYGPTPVSVDVSVTWAATYGSGNFPPGYPVYELASPSIHGLL